VLQIFVDLGQTGPARSLVQDLAAFRAVLEKIQDLKLNYCSDFIYVVNDNSAGKVIKQAEGPSKGQLNVEFYSVTMGAYLKTFAKSPKNPCLEEYDFALAYFETLINQAESKLEAADDCLKKAQKLHATLRNSKATKSANHDLVEEHTEKMLGYLVAKQEMHRGNLREALKDLPQTQDVIYYNNQGVLNLKMEKYGLASFNFSKAVQAFNRDGKQPDAKPFNLVTDHVD